MEAKFYENFEAFYANKRRLIITEDKYHQIVAALQKFSDPENSALKKTKDDFNTLSRFSIRTENSIAVLYHMTKNDPSRVVKKQELYGILKDAHIKLGHGGRDCMWQKLRTYYGISKEVIEIFLKLCSECELKKGTPKKGVVLKPITSDDRNSRCQVDLIDIQACPDGDYKFILVYQDHLTKYVLLRPLRTKTAVEIVEHLIIIFADFGCPRILHSDNGREFANKLVRDLVWRWPECKIVHGKPRHSQSQGSVERCNLDIQRILVTSLRDKKSIKWARELPNVQTMKNRRWHRGIKRSPYEAMFGKEMKMGNEDNIIPTEEERGIEDENDENESGEIVIDWSAAIISAATDDVEYYPASSNEDSYEVDDSVLNELSNRDETIAQERMGARESQKIAALKMVEESNRRYGPVNIGVIVRLPVDDVDRPKLGHTHIFGVVMELKDGFYRIGTKAGRLAQFYTRNQFDPCENSFLSPDDVPNIETTFRAAVIADSIVGTQGHKHCRCISGCKTKKCKCKNDGRLCNSRCHQSNPCNNK